MNSAPIQVTIEIMDSDYRISCLEAEQEALLEAARYLNEKMVEIRDSGKVLSVERIAVMAALNISHELLRCREECADSDNTFNVRLQSLLDKVEMAISKTSRMEV